MGIELHPSLFDELPDVHTMVHREDPVTSHEAAENLARSGKLSARKRAVLKALRKHPGLTGTELASYLPWDKIEVRKRLTDLKNAGLAYYSGRRLCTQDGTSQMLWYAVVEE